MIKTLAAAAGACCLMARPSLAEMPTENCQLSFWGYCKNRVECPAGTHSAGVKCYPTFTRYTYWVFGAPIPTGKICGCAPPPIPYRGVKFDKDGRPISAAAQNAIEATVSALDAEEVRKYLVAMERVEAILEADRAAANGDSLEFTEEVTASCDK